MSFPPHCTHARTLIYRVNPTHATICPHVHMPMPTCTHHMHACSCPCLQTSHNLPPARLDMDCVVGLVLVPLCIHNIIFSTVRSRIYFPYMENILPITKTLLIYVLDPSHNTPPQFFIIINIEHDITQVSIHKTLSYAPNAMRHNVHSCVRIPFK